ncbi:Alpha/Beta hydrolase protein [Protomyces lactucae-debilis]|uniref:Alpha/Beta hydrolase protein n=1 Tax=Protomyces lactucae-debilis TaxID=2754530 RepID=A0A1Y2ETB1_PROLT|nr:Alpha/Beta hydrolase protein [Protomyces lactucae-debilis]ORY74801.1 Alpha/Beta hydrolase protein [Protomyces lactucae-debilis]
MSTRNSTADEIYYKRLPSSESASKTSSVIFLHGLETSHIEFSLVTPFLSSFDLLLVDLPGHSRSRGISFSLQTAVDEVIRLIITQAHGNKAHIVGVSFGGFVALNLAKQRPDLILSVFCTGCAPFSGLWRFITSRPRFLARLSIVMASLATDAMFWYPIGIKGLPGLREEMRRNQSMSLLTIGYSAACSFTLADIAAIKDVRIAIVAGARRDNVENTLRAGKALVQNNPACCAFVIRRAVHLWDLQIPQVFAAGVEAWINHAEMPSEFEVLHGGLIT